MAILLVALDAVGICTQAKKLLFVSPSASEEIEPNCGS
jgi:hypothetical protein